MSNYHAPAIHPRTGKVERAIWVDHGLSRYTVLFADGVMVSADDVAVPDSEPEVVGTVAIGGSDG